jgi:hypothetical protein
VNTRQLATLQRQINRLAGKVITRVELHTFDTGHGAPVRNRKGEALMGEDGDSVSRADWTCCPTFHLADGTKIFFTVDETDSGDAYGVRPVIHRRADKRKR